MAVPVVEIVQHAVARVVVQGSTCVDATVGNGHDTLFLARAVGTAGHVFGFDIQDDALAQARRRLENEGLLDRVTLFRAGHEDALRLIPGNSRLTAVMFNLGYLPGGDHTMTTRAATTIRALQSLWSRLEDGGILTLVLYRGHESGVEEADTVLAWVHRAAAVDALASRYVPIGTTTPAPEALLLKRRIRRPEQERSGGMHE